MDEVKTLGFDWEFGHEELALEVASYARRNPSSTAVRQMFTEIISAADTRCRCRH